ncbi:MAG: SCO family protein [Gammaproteobacteria bacterium]|nr:SCO family protein [Gammaproteobacteria bacterium]
MLRLLLLVTPLIGLAAVGAAFAQESPGKPGAPAAGNALMSSAQYSIPEVRLVREDGKVVSLPEEMNDGRPVVLNFIYTTCSTICPLMSQTLAQFDHDLGADRERVHLMSISIDPEQDTVTRLREYARKFHAGPEWQHYTGTAQASLAAQRAFNVWRGDKMGHSSVTLLRAAPGEPWLRIQGFVTPGELLQQYHQVLEHSGVGSRVAEARGKTHRAGVPGA